MTELNLNFQLMGQLVGVVTSIIAIYMITLKSDEKLLKYNTIAAFISIFQWLFIGAYTASVIAVIITIRLLLAKIIKNEKLKKVFFYIFSLISCITCYYTWKNEYSLLPLISNMIVTYGIYFEKNIKLRIFILISNLLMFIYSVEFNLIAAIITYFLMSALGLFMIIKMKKAEK